MQRESFVFYESWYEILRDERQEVQWEVIRAIMEYVFNNNLIELKPNAKMAFKFIKRDIDRANDKYEEYLEKQRENGKRGGRPKKPKETQKNQAFFEKPTETQKSLNVNVNENVNVNKNVNNNSSYGESEILRIKNFLKTKQQIQMDRLMMQHKISKEDLFLKIDEFVEKKVSWGEVNWPNDSEIAKNFEFWLSKNPNKATPNGRSKRSVF
ncbi:hypothetical protein FO675_07050 [Riemerella anatipestifer]|uniref:DUF6291 domain-containing protein n=1 Tax=Riemerella anatipestifer TaxID=34085 RepID=UPI001AD65F86|nr:DUF6291 domain-containing protein [Riemerella anatipestifer]MBO4234059.1 hypothetical protein [Riemerella anatipestifer]